MQHFNTLKQQSKDIQKVYFFLFLFDKKCQQENVFMLYLIHTKEKEAQSRAKIQRHDNNYLFDWLFNNCGNRISSLRKAKSLLFFRVGSFQPEKIIPYMKHGCQEKISKNFQKICYPIIPNTCSLHRTKALKRASNVKKNLIFLHFTVKCKLSDNSINFNKL